MKGGLNEVFMNLRIKKSLKRFIYRLFAKKFGSLTSLHILY